MKIDVTQVQFYFNCHFAEFPAALTRVKASASSLAEPFQLLGSTSSLSPRPCGAPHLQFPSNIHSHMGGFLKLGYPKMDGL